MDHERDELRERLKLEAELEAARRSLRDALDFLGNDRHLTDKGIVAREALLSELGELERDLEAVRQEHGLG